MEVAETSNRTLSIKATLNSRQGAASRVICDIERFGFDLIEFQLSSSVDGGAIIRFVVSADQATDKDQLRARFERHPSVASVHVIEKAAKR